MSLIRMLPLTIPLSISLPPLNKKIPFSEVVPRFSSQWRWFSWCFYCMKGESNIVGECCFKFYKFLFFVNAHHSSRYSCIIECPVYCVALYVPHMRATILITSCNAHLTYLILYAINDGLYVGVWWFSYVFLCNFLSYILKYFCVFFFFIFVSVNEIRQ